MSDIKFVDRQESINPITQFGEYLYNRLPKVYRDYDVEIERLNVETQKKETFKTLKEYLYSFALGGFQPLLEDLEAIISLVDPFKCPSEFLPYLLRHFGLDYIDDIPEKFQRRLVQNVVTLYKKKGTIPAVAFLAKELSGFGVNIEEKSDGSIEFALIKLNAYEDEDAELLLAQDVIQRYIHLFLPAQTKSKIIVVYGFTENIHINPNGKSEDTTYDHAYYDVDEYEDITYIDENGYDSKTGGYSEAFDYLKHVVEDDFNALKLKLEEESHNFSPSLPDLTSLTNCVENDGLPMFTNGISCEDTITEQKLTSTTGEVEFNIPASASNISVNKLVGGGDYAVLPIYKCTTDLLKGTTLEFKYDGKSYGYYTLERDLYASENFPTTFQLDIYNNMVKVYNQYFVETIDGSYKFTAYTGYGSYYTDNKGGQISYDFLDDVRVTCNHEKGIEKMDSIYYQPTDSLKIAFSTGYVYISFKDVIDSVESAKEFLNKYPITIISPACKEDKMYSNTYAPPRICGHTIAYKKLSTVPVENSIVAECKVYTMEDRKTVFAYQSPVFIQSSNIAISGYYGLKTFPESHIISDDIQVTGHLTGVSLIDYKVYGNCVQNGTPSPDTPIEIQSVGDLVTDTASEYYGKYDVPITIAGKNLIYCNATTSATTPSTGTTITATSTGNTFLLNGGGTSNVGLAYKSNMAVLLKKGTYTLSYIYESGDMEFFPFIDGNGVTQNRGAFSIGMRSADSTWISGSTIDFTPSDYSTALKKRTFTLSEATYVSFGFVGNGTYNNLKFKFQLEYGADSTDYEPYQEPVTEHIYLDEPLRKIGEYADYIDYKNKKVVRNIYKRVFVGTENWRDTNVGRFYLMISAISGLPSNKIWCLCNRLIAQTWDTIWNNYKFQDGSYVVGIARKSDALQVTPYQTKPTLDEWKAQLATWNEEGNPFTVWYVDLPREEPIEVPDIITTDTNTMYMYLGTSIQPSSIDITYYENTPVPQLSEIVYDLGIPLVSFGGYSESIEKIDGKYYLRSAIKELTLDDMFIYLQRSNGVSNEDGTYYVDWFRIRTVSPYGNATPFYFNMSPCITYEAQPPINNRVYNGSEYVNLPNYSDMFDFMCFYTNDNTQYDKRIDDNTYEHTVHVNHFGFFTGRKLAYFVRFKEMYEDMFRYSDVPPKFYIYDKYNKYGGETLTEITDKEVINKLNLLPIPEDYAIISSKGIKYSHMDVSVQSKRYY